MVPRQMTLLRSISLAAVATVFAVWDATPASSAPKHRWRVAVVTPAGHPYNVALDHFKQRVEKGSNNEIEVTIFPSSQLGGEVESVKNVQLGTLTMTIVSTSNTSPFYKDLEALGVPYLFKSMSCGFKVLDGDVGKEMAAGLLKNANLRVLGWYTFGMRQIVNTRRPVLKPADMAGLKFRVPADKMAEEAYRALGASPIPMDFPEVFNALQQGVIDGADNPLITVQQFKWYEVVKHVSLTNTAAGLSPFMISERSFSRLPPDQQKLVLEAGAESTKINRDTEAAQTDKAAEFLKAQGVRIETVDGSAFREKVEPVFQAARQRFGDNLMKRIAEAQSGC
jgi:tripartite ATP-independent transporter DctP family solute receptor